MILAGQKDPNSAILGFDCGGHPIVNAITAIACITMLFLGDIACMLGQQLSYDLGMVQSIFNCFPLSAASRPIVQVVEFTWRFGVQHLAFAGFCDTRDPVLPWFVILRKGNDGGTTLAYRSDTFAVGCTACGNETKVRRFPVVPVSFVEKREHIPLTFKGKNHGFGMWFVYGEGEERGGVIAEFFHPPPAF